MAEGNFEKLPKWAQEKINSMQRTLDAQEKVLAALTGKTPMTEAHVLVTRDDSNDYIPFPRHTETQFVLSPKDGNRRAETVQAVVMTDRDGERYLRILGDRPLNLRPISSNGFELRML